MNKKNYSPYSENFKVESRENIYLDRVKELNKNNFQMGFIDAESEINRGKWRKEFRVDASTFLHLDIGCGLGTYLIEWAKENKNKIYIAIDWKAKNIFAGVKNSLTNKITNIRWLKARGERINYIFEDGEVDKVTFYHPDPWPKKKQIKNRLFSDDFVSAIHRVLKKDGELEIKTDHEDYFKAMCEYFEHDNKYFKLENKIITYESLHTTTTKFEKIFLKKGQPIHWLFLRKIIQ